MKFGFVFGLILIILVLAGIFVGIPYLFQIIKENQFFNIPFLSSSTSTGTFFGKPSSKSQASQPVAVVKPGESIYKGEVNISSVYRSGREQINLSAASFGSGSINITGWKIKSVQRGETVIGKGVALPQFTSFSSDIWIKGGDSVKIISGTSPLFSSFQVNSCFGWLNKIYNIDSSLNSCPAFKLSDLPGLNSACQDLMLRTNCANISEDVLNRQSYQCRQWADQNLGYNACVSKHMNDSDFYKGWQIYTGNNYLFYDQLHDRVELRDQAGLLVDSEEY